MFSRDSKPRIDTLIGRAARVAGDFEFEGGLHLEGRIAGNVRTRGAGARESTLSVSESGSIEGTVTVPNVELHGTVRGDIHASARLVLGSTARVEGDVYYRDIEISPGAQIMGKLLRQSGEVAATPAVAAGAGQRKAAGPERAA